MGRPYAQQRYINNVDRIFPGDGPFDIPIIEPEKWEPCEFVPFNIAKKRTDRSEIGVHFFIDDYQFEATWSQWKRYGKFLSEYKAVMTPDFSMFTDWPVAVQIWNHYRKHYIGAYLQELGVHVYPTICWSDESSYEWCFDGEPVGGCVAVSSMGTQKNPETKRLFLSGWREMIDRLHPETIIFYGKVPKECTGDIIMINPMYDKFEEAQMGEF